MKNTLFLILLLAAIYVAINFSSQQKPQRPNPTPTEVPKPNDLAYSYEFRVLSDLRNIKLISNLDEKKPTFEIKDDCDFLVNGGFYTEDYQHIGLFVSDYDVISDFQNNQTLNGLLTIDDVGVSISQAKKSNSKNSVQSGPLLKLEGKYLDLSLTNDKNARRVVSAVTEDGELVFIIIYDEYSRLTGPELVELPNVVSHIEVDEGLKFTDAVNLDGGSASTFIDKDANFVESAVIGSYFCVSE